MFGITKQHFAEWESLGSMENDWCIDLTDGSKKHNNLESDYGKLGTV